MDRGTDQGPTVPHKRADQTPCPACRSPLIERERITTTHVPSSVPEHAEALYRATVKYALTECRNGHRFRASSRGNDGQFRCLVGTTERGRWDAP